jgi:hypothetical protein
MAGNTPNSFFELADPRFREFALSWAGCRGGSRCAKVWACGIEYGTGSGKKAADHDLSPKQMLSPVEDYEAELRYQYGVKLHKLVFSVTGLWAPDKGADYRELAMRLHPFGERGLICRFNLFPLPFRTDSDSRWNSQVAALTGIATKDLYGAWCRVFRFPMFLRELLERRNRGMGPDLIICTGTSRITDFVHAFGGLDDLRCNLDAVKKHVSEEGSTLYSVELRSTETPMFIVPFLGRGLNSDRKIHAVGKKLASLIDERE